MTTCDQVAINSLDNTVAATVRGTPSVAKVPNSPAVRTYIISSVRKLLLLRGEMGRVEEGGGDCLLH